MLAEIVMQWNGLIAVQAKWHFDFQANSIKHRRVLSVPRLGREDRNHRQYKINESQDQWGMFEYERLTHNSGLGEL
ncbi:transposase (fragment) [Vibrio tapetis subsp. tapetis]|uniref:Transposase n=1 Tax=Vibrio tapetis subsp. tapetis TaxID=1671868 RepID=A0A2N8ZJZ3_9VIBR